MMRRVTIYLAVVAYLLANLSTGVCAQSNKKSSQQTSFSEDEEFQQLAELPKAILDILAKSDRIKDCLKYDRSLKESNASWFDAAVVTLGHNASSGFVVKGKQSCLWAADASWFWIFRQTDTGYDMALSDAGNALSLLNSYTAGNRDVTVFRATAAELSTTTYKFNGTVYHIAKNTSKPVPHN